MQEAVSTSLISGHIAEWLMWAKMDIFMVFKEALEDMERQSSDMPLKGFSEEIYKGPWTSKL